MTWKKFWKRVNALLHDNRTVLREGEDIEDWEEVQRKQREVEAERQKKEQEILAIWFFREEYLNASWFKRLLLRIELTRAERVIFRRSQTRSALRLHVASYRILWLTLNRSKVKESLPNGKRGRKPRKRKKRGRVTSLRNSVNL